MFGAIIYQGFDGYAEYLLADEGNVRAVACIQGSQVKLYRIEWTEDGDYQRNAAAYTLIDAIALFQEKAGRDEPASLPTWLGRLATRQDAISQAPAYVDLDSSCGN
jgi:hypothetical protein